MTVEELNIKISADADDFKRELAAAKAAIEDFRSDAVAAGKAVTDAFSGLVDLQLGSGAAGAALQNTAAVTPADTSAVQSSNRGVPAVPVGIPSDVPAKNISYNAGNNYSRTANVLELDRSETVVGAASAAADSSQPVNITTTVELDGDNRSTGSICAETRSPTGCTDDL